MVKGLLIVLLLLLKFNFCNGQGYYFAGDTLPGYVDISPDSLVWTYCPGSMLNEESIFFDFNNDNQPELQLYSRCSVSPGHSHNSFNIIPLDSSLYTLFGRTDSVFHTYFNSWWTANVAKPLLEGDTINSLNADWRNQTLNISLSNYMAGTSQSVYDWKTDSTDKFIGLKYHYGIDTIYGWIRLNCFPAPCLIRDFSLSSNLIDIENLLKSTIIVYPIPASNKISVETNNQTTAEIILFNSLGQHVKSNHTKNGNLIVIDVSELSNGIYFLKISSGDGYINRKIVVQH
jgi:hypothetical protein